MTTTQPSSERGQINRNQYSPAPSKATALHSAALQNTRESSISTTTNGVSNDKESFDFVRLLRHAKSQEIDHTVELVFDDLAYRLVQSLKVSQVTCLIGVNSSTDAAWVGGSSTALLFFNQNPILQSLCARAAQHFKPIVINDVKSYALTNKDDFASIFISSILAVPVRVPGYIAMGYLCATHYLPKLWSAQEIALLSVIAQCVGFEVAIRLNLHDQRYRRNNMRLTRLYQIIHKAIQHAQQAEKSPDNVVQQSNIESEVLQWLLSQAIDLFEAPHGFAYFSGTPQSEALPILSLVKITHQVAHGAFKSYLPRQIQIHVGKGLSGKVWREQKPIVVQDYEKWSERTMMIEKGRVRAMAAVPIKLGSVVQGVLAIGYADDKQFSAYDVEALSQLANMAAVAMRLHIEPAL
jgi:GAF domain-containing protein